MTSLSRMLAHVGVRELYLAYILHDGAASTQQLRIVTDRRATRKINRLARATKSGIAHAVKSFNNQHARSCDEVYLASLTWICDADRLYTDAALVLDASTSIVAAAGSGLIFTNLLQVSHATAAHEHRLCLCKTM